jgi:4-amino-4-deoxy-L-arabinose transferase-like glycosyltransferase
MTVIEARTATAAWRQSNDMNGYSLDSPQPIEGSSLDRQERPTLLFLGVYLVTWAALPLLSGREIPMDNLELLDWGAHPAWGYPKHPPLPAWIIYVFAQVFPATVPMTYGLGALQVGMMLWAAWLLMRQLLGTRTACVGVLLISCITFYTNRLHFFNHNTALLVATAAAVYCTWQAARFGRSIWWIALGLCWGVGLLSKYQMVVTIACNLAFLWTRRSANAAATLRGLLLAGAVAVVLLLPHVEWVVSHGLPTVHYAEKYVGAEHSLIDRVVRMISFTADQALRLVPLLILLLALRPFTKAVDAPTALERRTDEQLALLRRFLAIHAWGPLVIMNLLGLLFGLRLGMHWGTAFLWLLPLWLVATAWGQKLVCVQPRTILIGVAGVQIAMALSFALRS